MLLDDLPGVARLHLRVKGLVRIHDQDRPLLAEAETARAPHLDLVLQPVLRQFLAQRLAHFGAGRRRTTRAHAHGDPAMVGIIDIGRGFRFRHQVIGVFINRSSSDFFTAFVRFLIVFSSIFCRNRPITSPSSTATGASAHEPRQ